MVLHNIFAGGGSFNVHFIARLYPYIDFIKTYTAIMLLVHTRMLVPIFVFMHI